jgi:hypothetical protein
MEYSFRGQRAEVTGSPTATEKDVIESYIAFRAHLGFSASMVILRKRRKDNWCYRLQSWPSPEMLPDPNDDPRSLTSLLDWINVLRDREWKEWKAAHPGIFAHSPLSGGGPAMTGRQFARFLLHILGSGLIGVFVPRPVTAHVPLARDLSSRTRARCSIPMHWPR